MVADPIVTAWESVYGPIPDDYHAVDVESTGLSVDNDFILQVGYCRVRNRVPALSHAVVINWPDALPAARLSEFVHQLELTRERMVSKGKAYPWTVDLLRRRGRPPEEVATTLAAELGPEPAVAAHFGWFFDFPMIARLLARYGASPLAAYTHRMIDTCVLEKARLLGLYPRPGEDVGAYYRRVRETRGAPKHTLEACLDRLGLRAQGADPAATHDAGYDAWAVHLILEHWRRPEAA